MNPRPRLAPIRRWLRPTVAAMMALVLAIGGGLGWIAHRARTQRLAVAKIGSRGSVAYDWQYRDGKRVADGKPRGPRWLRDALGADVFDTVVFLGLKGATLDGDVMEAVGKLDSVEGINVQGSNPQPLTSDEMAPIRRLTRLKRLTVQGPKDSGGFLPHLGGLSRLRVLWLQSASPTNADMTPIGRLTNLEELERFLVECIG